ncbi:MAG: site-specific integrase [Coriobacteriia bacterium]|nr:site-specific integrase [Coriobacteriia bacterium]
MKYIVGAGTIEKRYRKDGSGYYRIRLNLGVDSMTGKQLYSPWRSGFRTKAEAQAALIEYRKEIENGYNVKAESMTFAQFSELFHTQRKNLGTIAESTLEKDYYQIKTLNKYVGQIALREIDVVVINKLIEKLDNEGKSDSTKVILYQKFNQIMRVALKQGDIIQNPFDKLSPLKQKKRKIRYLDDDELTILLNALNQEEKESETLVVTKRKTAIRKEHKFEKNVVGASLWNSRILAVRFMLGTGTRRGECLGLSWGQIDFKKAELRINQQQTDNGIKEPKTEHSIRTISLDRDTLELLREHKAKQMEFLFSIGKKQNAKTPVFNNTLGGFMEIHKFNAWFRYFREKYNLGDIKLHTFRHTHATHLIGNNVDIKTVQNRLGHSKASTTLDIYAEVMPANDREAAEKIGEIIRKANKPLGEIVNI